MKTAVLKFKKNQEEQSIPYIDGNYEFNISEQPIFNSDLIPVKKISFEWSVEMSQDVNYSQRSSKEAHEFIRGSMSEKENELFEMLADKLKNDFLKFIKSGR
jgi:hypothetical protein